MTPSPGVKLLGHEADYPVISITDVKNWWSFISSPPYIFME
jgi:hypothetical protein